MPLALICCCDSVICVKRSCRACDWFLVSGSNSLEGEDSDISSGSGEDLKWDKFPLQLHANCFCDT